MNLGIRLTRSARRRPGHPAPYEAGSTRAPVDAGEDVPAVPAPGPTGPLETAARIHDEDGSARGHGIEHLLHRRRVSRAPAGTSEIRRDGTAEGPVAPS